MSKLFSVVTQLLEVEIDRSVDRTDAYSGSYWSANKVNYNPEVMRQRRSGLYKGDLGVAQCLEEVSLCDLDPALQFEGWEFAEIMEAFWFGVEGEELVHEYKDVLVPGTLASPPQSRSTFCPILFRFGDAISIGIELVNKKDHKLVLPAGTYVLVRNI